jgi:G3E family GTPase
MSDMLPFTLLTGFLGSGKTTLLNQLLASPHLARAAVLVNELVEVGIDHLLVRHANEELVVLDSGCVCCTLRKDLVAQLLELLALREQGKIPRFDRVVLETTGLADAAPVAQTMLSHPELSERFYLDGVVVTVDAQHAEATLTRYRESQAQLAIADRVVITKVDLVSSEQARRVERLVRTVNPLCKIAHAALGAVDPRFVMGTGHLDTRELGRDTKAGHEHDCEKHEHTHVRSVAVTLDAPVDFRAFSLWVSMLTQLNGERILRLKAVVCARGEPTPVAVQAVRHVVYPPLTLPETAGLGGKSHVVVLTHGMSDAELTELRAEIVALGR